MFRAIDTISDRKAWKDIYAFVQRKMKVEFWDMLTKDQREETEWRKVWVKETERSESPSLIS